MSEVVYIRMKQNIHISPGEVILIADIAHIVTTFHDQELLLTCPIKYVVEDCTSALVIEGFTVIKQLHTYFPSLQFEFVSHNETIVHIKASNKKRSILLIGFVWLLLFIGTAMTIINFHYDVSMQEVHQRIHFLLTSEKVVQPLFIQIPYSIGLGAGMVLFLNHWFKKKINDEPSPLEVELFNYERNLDKYLVHEEMKRND